jgi:SecA DEAD-like domain
MESTGPWWQSIAGFFKRTRYYEGESGDTSLAAAVLQREPEFRGMRDERMPRYADWLDSRVARGEALPRILPDVLGAMREVLRRQGHEGLDGERVRAATWATRGKLVALAAGEWHLAMPTLAAWQCSFEGKGLHLVTGDDQAAEALHAQLQPLVAAFGREVGLVRTGDERAARHQAYRQRLTCVAMAQLGHDLLRDRLSGAREPLVMPHAALLPRAEEVLYPGRWFGLQDEKGETVAGAGLGELLGHYLFLAGFVEASAASLAALIGLELAPLSPAARAACQRTKPERGLGSAVTEPLARPVLSDLDTEKLKGVVADKRA